jgi:hypothetical protein
MRLRLWRWSISAFDRPKIWRAGLVSHESSIWNLIFKLQAETTKIFLRLLAQNRSEYKKAKKCEVYSPIPYHDESKQQQQQQRY